MMLTLLISGPQQLGNDIDIYLAPLIEDLKTLWEIGVEAYDAYQKEVFTLRVVLLWTINDFPAYGNLFTDHKHFLPCNHPFRKCKRHSMVSRSFNHLHNH